MFAKVSLEMLYHYQCPHCWAWWSRGDRPPVPGKLTGCPDCFKQFPTPEEVLVADDFEQQQKLVKEEGRS